MATATAEATRTQTIINHEAWCSDHQYDVGTDDEGHGVLGGWCEADLEAASYTVTLTTGTNERGPRICVEHGREEFLTPAEAEELSEAVERMVAAARGVATTDPERRRLGAVSPTMFDELAARLGVDLVDMVRAVMATVHAADTK